MDAGFVGVSDFLKCECPHCGQAIEFPSEGTGQVVPCPTCESPVTLKPRCSLPPPKSEPLPATDQDKPKDLENSGSDYIAAVRAEPATEKQKRKLLFFGYALRDGMTKGEASDALDECASRFPQRDAEYYERPATEEQLAELREYSKTDEDLAVALKQLEEEEEDILTYGEAKDLLQECERNAEWREMDRLTNPPDNAQRTLLKELGFDLDTSLEQVITAEEIDEILRLREAPPTQLDLELFDQHGVTSFKGDGLAACALGDLIRAFGGSAQPHNRRSVDYRTTCQAALADPAYQAPIITRDWEGFVAFAWPKAKIREWLQSH